MVANDGVAEAFFGGSVAINNGTIVVGAVDDDNENGEDSGSAYVYIRNGDTPWTQQAKLMAKDGAAYDYFGRSVDVDGDTVVVGARYDDDGTNNGSVYIFTRSGTTWSQQSKLVAEDGADGDRFGNSVAVDGDTIVVGASGNDNENGKDSGSAYVFTRTGTTWTQQAKLLPKDGAAGDDFGKSVAIHGGTIVVGAMYDDNENGADSGSAYVFYC